MTGFATEAGCATRGVNAGGQPNGGRIPVDSLQPTASFKYVQQVRLPSSLTDQVGVHAVAKIIATQMNWAFQRHSEFDHGIDAVIEELQGERPTGRAVALQIKSGSSYFRETSQDGDWILRVEKRHLDYWLSYQMPVVVVLYDPDGDCAYWAHVNKSSSRFTARNAVVEVPRLQVVSAKSRDSFASVSDSWRPHRPDATSHARLAIVNCLATGLPVPPTPESWAKFAREKSMSSVLFHNLPLQGTAPVVHMARENPQPFAATITDLNGFWLVPAGTEVYVLENSGPLGHVAARLGRRSPPLVCMSGFPNGAVEYLLLGLGFCMAKLHVHTDHDKSGKRISQTMLHRTIEYEPWCPGDHDDANRFEEQCVDDWIRRSEQMR